MKNSEQSFEAVIDKVLGDGRYYIAPVSSCDANCPSCGACGDKSKKNDIFFKVYSSTEFEEGEKVKAFHKSLGNLFAAFLLVIFPIILLVSSAALIMIFTQNEILASCSLAITAVYYLFLYLFSRRFGFNTIKIKKL